MKRANQAKDGAVARKKPETPLMRLCAAVAAADEAKFKPTDEAIAGDSIRRLALQHPLPGENEARPLSAFGIRIVGATISERILLDNARPRDIRPVCPIEFEDCLLQGGFSGAHGHFSRLSFRNCRFSDPPDVEGRPVPTIDLSGADIDSDLHMAGIRPEGIESESVRPRDEGHHLWVRLIGARIRGEVDLCCCHLRAPPFRPHPVSEDAENALDLMQAEIGGDLQMVGGARCEGRVKIRTASLAADVCMSGARIEIAPDEPALGNDEALTFQGACIGGYLMLNGDFDDICAELPGCPPPESRFRKFRCTGKLRLQGAEIGRSLHLEEAVVHGDVEAAQLSVRDDLRLHAKISGSIDLSACRIGGSLDLSRLNLAASSKCVSLKDGNIGRALQLAEPRVPYELIKVRRVGLVSLPGLQLVETLWGLARDKDGRNARDENDEDVPIRRRLVQAAFLVDPPPPGLRRFLRLDEMRIYHLDGHADVLSRAVERYGFLGRTAEAKIRRFRALAWLQRKLRKWLPLRRRLPSRDKVGERRRVEAAARQEYARLYGAYVLTEEGFVRIQDPPRPAAEAASPAAEGRKGKDSGTFRAAAAIGGRIEEREFEVRTEDHQVKVMHRRGDGRSRVQEDPRWFVNGLVVAPPARTRAGRRPPEAETWLAPAPLAGMEEQRRVRLGRATLRKPRRKPGLVRRIVRRWRRGPIKHVRRRIGLWWSVRRPIGKLTGRIAPHVESIPLLQAEFNLEGLACDMLDDRGGRAWGEHSDRIRMNHFVYRRATWGPQARSSARYVLNRLKSARADWFWSPMLRQWPERLRRRLKRFGIDWRGLSWLSARAERLREENDYLEPWQVRRNWIYRHFTPARMAGLISISRFRIPEGDYRPQPFEQAILVARAEGREDYAACFEMLKSGNEWRYFNERIRWWLGPAAITVASCWLLGHEGSVLLTVIAWATTLAMMVWISAINDGLAKVLRGWWLRRAVRELTLYVPALVLLFADWWDRPFYYIVAFFIYLAIRCSGVLSHAVMRFGFGYLRRPVRAIVTLILAFLLGWGGVSVAVRKDMLAIDATAVADRAAAYEPAHGAELMGMRRVAEGPGFVHEPSCAPVLSERLYALDVLIPLIDLNEESRCEVRRVPKAGTHSSPYAKLPGEMSGRELAASIPRLTAENHRFWWWLKALYAIAGWFIVSLALLTFTQVNRTRGEIPES